MRRLLCFFGFHAWEPFFPTRSHQEAWLPLPGDRRICRRCPIEESFVTFEWRRFS